MSEISMPIICPDCNCEDVCEVAEAVCQKIDYKWAGGETQRYIEDYEDNENFGDLYLMCANCGRRYDQEHYDTWVESPLEHK